MKTPMLRALVTGATGFVGQALRTHSTRSVLGVDDILDEEAARPVHAREVGDATLERVGHSERAQGQAR